VGTLPNLGLGMFDSVISNPPFGRVSRDWSGPRYTGRDFEFHLIDLASDHARHGAFIIPQTSAGFQFSGSRCFEERKSSKYLSFEKQTGISLEPGCGIDTTFYKDEWNGVSPLVESCTVDFKPIQEVRAVLAETAQAPQEQLAMAV